jgi:vacuolar iron transporter family protein
MSEQAGSASRADLRRYRENLRSELDGAALYDALAAAESDRSRREVFAQLAEAERQHAELWRAKLSAAGTGARVRA